MFDWLHAADVGLFRAINQSLANGFFDWLMPRVSDPPCGVPLLIALLALLAWKGGARGRLFAAMFVLALFFGNWLTVDSLKHLVARPRPFHEILDARALVGRGDSPSMPSSHAANWFSAAMIALIYYRRVAWALFPAAALVGFSRVYNGVHYPSDVLAGAVVGMGYAAAVVFGFDALWQWAGPKWFRGWQRRLPSLTLSMKREPGAEDAGADDGQWLRLAYVVMGALFVARIAFLASGRLELSEDEAYQWVWSKHLAISYYSKPPMIAYTQFLGTHLWGDNQFGVRFFSPVITLVISLALVRFMAGFVGGRAAFVLLLACTAAPLLSVGAIVMTIDPLSVMFWVAAMIAGWRATQPAGTTRDWLWTGLWVGLGFLSKPTAAYQVICFAVFFCLWPPARAHLRKRGPWLALLVSMACMAPVVGWNAAHDWVTVKHVAADGQLERPWTRIYVHDFLLAEFLLLNPVFFAGAIWASIAFWRRGRNDPLQLWLFSMGTPLFLLFFLLSWHSRVFPNWIAPSVAPMFCLMIVYWRARWDALPRALRHLPCIGIAVGAVALALAHDTRLLERALGRRLPADPLRRAHGWRECAAVVGQARDQLQAEGKPAFMIGEHYGFVGEVTFYLPEAKRSVMDPIVFFYASKVPQNQFYFWPSYLDRHGQNALFYREAPRPKLKPGWFSRWWRREGDLLEAQPPEDKPPPQEVIDEFESVTNMGVRDIVWDGRIVRSVELFACHNLR